MTWGTVVLVMLLAVTALLVTAHDDSLRYAGRDKDRRQPNRRLTVGLAALVLALSAVVLFSIGAAVLRSHPSLAHRLHGPGGMDSFLDWVLVPLVVLAAVGLVALIFLLTRGKDSRR